MAYFHENLKYHEDTKVKRAISKDDIDFLKALQKERNTQDNCETADVRTWVIKDRNDTVTEEGHEDYYLLYDSENCNNLDLKDIYDILKALEFETDYYTEELVIENLNFDELKNYKIKDKKSLKEYDFIDLKTVIEKTSGKIKLNIELKPYNNNEKKLAKEVAKLVADRPHDVVVSSLDPKALREIKNNNTNII